jgi:hypothetical protein
MGQINVSAERTVGAPAGTVYGYIADHLQHHPNFLPPAFSDFKVQSGGVGATVRLETSWDGAGGIGGFFERAFAPRVMRGIYDDELGRLDEYARGQPSAPPPPAG